MIQRPVFLQSPCGPLLRVCGLVALVLFLGKCGPVIAVDVPAALGKGVSPETWAETVATHKGHYTLFTLWEVTCEPCVEEMPGLIEVYRQLKPKGLTICAVNTDPASRHEMAAKLVDRLQIPFERYYKLPGPDVPFHQVIDPEYGANPFAVLYGPDGSKVKTFADAHTQDEWLALLLPYLEQPGGVQATSQADSSSSRGGPDLEPSSEEPLSLIGLPMLGMPEVIPEESSVPLPKGSVQSGRSPFRVDAPSWKPVSATETRLVVPFGCKQDAHLILSTLMIDKIRGKGIHLGQADVSKKDYYYMEIRGETEEILRTPGSVLLPLSILTPSPSMEIPFEVVLTYQGCTDGTRGACYPPESFALAGTLTSTASGLEVRGLEARWLDPMQPKPKPEESPEVGSAVSQTGTQEMGDGGSVAGLFTSDSLHDTTIVERAFRRSLFLVFVLAFIGGILTSFTPCVYPMIPATVAIFGAKEVKSRLASCSLAATYIMGVALSYASLGILAATVGTVFGTMMENPWLISIVAAFYVILALSMLDAFVFYLPSSWVSAASRVNRKGYTGAFLMGLVSSIVFAPCGEPILLGILAWVAKTQSFFLGFWLLFVYAWGIGVLFFVIATFSSSIQYLPRAGAWMVAVKDFFGLLLFGLALFWLQFVLPPAWLWGLATIYFLGVATFIHTKNHGFEGWPRVVLSFATLAAMLAGSLPLQRFALLHGWLPNTAITLVHANSDMTGATSSIPWLKESPLTDLARAQAMGKPVIVDYRTNVCPKCDEIEHKVFSNPEVRKALAGFVTIQVNLSEVAKNKEIREIQSRQAVFAVPVIEFYDSKGNFLSHKRIADVLTAEEFLKHIQDIG
jgi:thioredoxin:protein disulfide reductase